MFNPIINAGSKWYFALFIALIFYSCNSESKQNADFFEGEISYSYTYKSAELNADSIASERPHTGTFRFDQENYQSIFEGKTVESYYYLSSMNSCINEYNNDGKYTCEDYSIETDSVLNFKIYETEEKVLDLDCFILEFQGKYFWNKFYISKKIKLSPKIYQKHAAYNWKFYGETCEGGLILKVEHHFKNFIMYGELTRIDYFNNNEKALEIPLSVFEEYCNEKLDTSLIE